MFQDCPDYQVANPALWQGRTDTPHPERFFQKITFIDTEQALITPNKKTILLGFASDAGIIRNQGRPGAKQGPDQLKSQLAKLPCPTQKEFLDLGSILCKEDDLEAAQEQFAQLILFCHQQGHKTVAFGGGHEIAWGHYQGLAPFYKKVGIINFDAHFDLRPCESKQGGSSGTPFSQIAHYCEAQGIPFDYCCVGIQKFGNTPSLFQKAQMLHANYLSAEDVNEQSLAWQIAFLDEFIAKQDRIYLTLCLDVLAECFAPGVSAPQPLGLTPWQIMPLLKYVVQSGKVVSLDIAELSPPFDKDQKTARLAALIAAELLNIY